MIWWWWWWYCKHTQVVCTKLVCMHCVRFVKTHGMCEAAIQTIFRSVIIAELTYAASTWRWFTKASDRQWIDALRRRCKRHGYYATHLPMFDELCDTADEQLFDNIQTNNFHILQSFLARIHCFTAPQNYNLRHKTVVLFTHLLISKTFLFIYLIT